MEKNSRKLTLDRPITYQIRVPAHLDDSWSDWVEGMAIEVQNEEDGSPVTTLTCTVDQAALHGLLRRLYSLGLPLISVNHIEGQPPRSVLNRPEGTGD